MLTELFKHIVLLSCIGGILSLLLLAARPLTRRLFSPRWQYYIWLTVLLVMVLPVSFHLPQTPPEHMPAGQMTQIVDTPQITANETQPQAAVGQYPLPQDTPIGRITLPQHWLSYASLLWLCGALLLLGIKLTRYGLFVCVICKHASEGPAFPNLPRRLRIRQTEMLDAPLLVGLFRPVLYLPAAALTQTDWQYVLLHELTHYRRHDLLYKWAAMLIGCIHWFNPLSHFVLKQIDLECEVSCDFAVAGHLPEAEQRAYMRTILELLCVADRHPRLLTTQMASNKQILKRRFTMLKTKKATGKFMSALSAAVAIILFSTTVFASGILSGLTEDEYSIEMIANDGAVLTLTNKPFLEDGEIYLPLRETFEQLGYNETNSYIRWDNGTIDIAILNYPGENGLYRLKIGEPAVQLRHFQGEGLDGANWYDETTLAMRLSNDGHAPVLRGSTTYVPLETMNYILYGFLNRRTEENELYELTYQILDRNQNDITAQFDQEKRLQQEAKWMQNPEYTAMNFFYAFEDGDFEAMKQYCTQSCVSDFFGDGYVFGMTTATLTDIQIDPLEYAKSSNDFVVTISVNMTPHENSVFAPDQTTTSFYLILQRQPDGRYLIDEFATGL